MLLITFISDSIYLGALSFSLMSLPRGLSILFILLKSKLLTSLIYSILFSSLYFIYFCSVFCFFLLITLTFIYFYFFGSLDLKINFLCGIFLIFSGRSVLGITFLIELLLLLPIKFKKLCFHIFCVSIVFLFLL